ncbi:MAG: UvrD-helicase domain-containing protein, partial [Actinomycetota bacterium]
MDRQLAPDLSRPGHDGPPEDLFAGLNDAQRQAASFGEGPLLIVAGAGSGKTAVLTRRVAHLIRDRDVPPFSILAITFTNKAAAQMRQRIEGLIGPVVKAMWIGTFHSMMARLLRREAPKLPGASYTSSFTIYDSADSDRLVTHILKESTISASRFKPSQVRHAISRAKDEMLGPDDLEGSGRWDLRQIAPVFR